MISRVRSGSRDKKFNMNINKIETVYQASHHASPSSLLSAPRSLLGSGGPLPFQPLPSLLSIHWFNGWAGSIKYWQNYHNFVVLLRLCIRWPIWQVWKIFAGPQQVPGDIWSPGATGGGPLIGGPACHSQHHAGLKNMITLIFLICTADLSRKLRIHSMMKMMFASVGGGVDSQIWMMMVSWVGLFISLNLHIVTCQGSGNGRREGGQTSRSGMTLQCRTFRTTTACSSSPQLAMVD